MVVQCDTFPAGSIQNRGTKKKKLPVSTGGHWFKRAVYLSLLLPLELLPVDPARVRLPLDSPESFRVRLPTCSFELALLTLLV